jgi:leucyl aminopeptidase
LSSREDNESNFIESSESLFEVAQPAVVLPVHQEEGSDLLRKLDQTTNGLIEDLRKSGEFAGKRGEILNLFAPRGLKSKRLILVGLGKKNEVDPGVLRENLEIAFRKIRKRLNQGIACYCGPEIDLNGAAPLECTIESAIAAVYDPGHYKTAKINHKNGGKVVLLTSGTGSRKSSIFRATILGEANQVARRLAFEPGNKLNPVEFSNQALEIAEKAGLKCEVLHQDKLESLGMEALVAVAQGSKNNARMLVLHHESSDPRAPALLVGKGVTFDAGGISLKPASSMEEMKGDKAGASAVLGAMTAISRLKIGRNVKAVIPLVENLPGGGAQRPGDVVRSYSSKTIEIINTDAEGRLILADSISWAKERFNPECIVDIATLTGACMVALGRVRAGYFANSEELSQKLEAAARKSGEKLWRLPLDPEYREDLLSDIADIKNLGGRWGGAATAAKFLQEFVEDTPWCHIDMAGKDFFPKGNDLVGATGFGAILLTCFAEELV